MTDKKAGKAGRKPGTFKKGHDARRNVTKPGSGRPPDEFKELCRSLATREETIAAVEAILADPTHGAFIGALKWASEHGYGKPTQPLEHGVTAGLADAIRAARQRAGI